MTLVSAGYRAVQRTSEFVSISECVAEVHDDWFRDVVLARHTGLEVLEVGLSPEEAEPIVREILAEGWDRETSVVVNRIERGASASGELLGFELVGYDGGLWHTWRCLGGLVDDVRAATGIVPGRHGLIEDEDAAHQAARWLTESGLGDPKVFHWAAAGLFLP
ncbi:hypothetical protein CU254_09805 [Amycolatopsis sp. AA4]|uniref:hypothetical protein n=1 Tax=Actinomycetes TaxID=1760 RepID=UPI0001B56548|nr:MULTISPECIES: hypothetical protein [Actinomycetes]ATY10728.1 hypothetical protein CU254_09805 [Amycolatopsis sp. AA4]EFL06246.1 predicted protein [Streptomyces sp. AA4]